MWGSNSKTCSFILNVITEEHMGAIFTIKLCAKQLIPFWLPSITLCHTTYSKTYNSNYLFFKAQYASAKKWENNWREIDNNHSMLHLPCHLGKHSTDRTHIAVCSIFKTHSKCPHETLLPTAVWKRICLLFKCFLSLSWWKKWTLGLLSSTKVCIFMAMFTAFYVLINW